MSNENPNNPQKRNLLKDFKIIESLELPKGCPWRIEVQPLESTNMLEILLVQGEKTLNLQELCPKNFKGFKHGIRAEYDDMTEMISFPPRLHNSKYLLLTLLHEIGHSHSTLPDLIINRTMQNVKIILDSIQYNKAGKLKKIFMKKPDKNLIKWETREDIYQEERFAWSYAFQKTRELQREGFYISQGCDLKAAQKYMTLALLTYELKHDPLGQHPTIIKKVNRKVFRALYGKQ